MTGLDIAPVGRLSPKHFTTPVLDTGGYRPWNGCAACLRRPCAESPGTPATCSGGFPSLAAYSRGDRFRPAGRGSPPGPGGLAQSVWRSERVVAGEGDPDGGAMPRRRGDADRAAVCGHDRLDDGQTQTRRATAVTAAAGIGAVEPLEHVRQVLRRDPVT